MVLDWGNIIYVLIGAVPALIVRTIDSCIEVKRIKLDEKKWQSKYFLEEKNRILRNLHKSIAVLYYSTVSYVLGDVKIKNIEEYNEYKSQYSSFKINKDLAKIYLNEIENSKISEFFTALDYAQNNIYADLSDDLDFKKYYPDDFIENRKKINTTNKNELNNMLRSSYDKALECLIDKLNPEYLRK